MGEDLNTTVDTTAETAAETGDSFLEGWEEDTNSTAPEDDAEEEGAGNQGAQSETDSAEGTRGDPAENQGGGKEAGTAEQEDAGDQGVQQQEPPRTWRLTHLGQQITANEADMVVLAQKGLDYDRIRDEYDAAKPIMALFRDFAGKAGMDVPAYLARVRAQAKQAEGMSQEEALRAVDLEDREAVLRAKEEQDRVQREAAEQEQARRQAEEARRQADIREFLETFPEAAQDPQSIPQEVWAAVRSGRSLVGAYAAYAQNQAREAAEQAAAAAVQQQNLQNAERSAGSMRTSGANSRKDPFMEGFED